MRKVFLSSTAKDLAPYRQAVHDALVLIGRVDVEWMRGWVSQDATSLAVCERRVRDSDLFVGLVGHCFGSAPKERPERSYTMLEWDWATGASLPRLMHVMPRRYLADESLIAAESPEDQERQKAFREIDLSGRHTGQPEAWANADRLATHVAIAVNEQLARMDAAERPGFSKPGWEAELYRRLGEVTEALDREGAASETQRAEKAELESRLRDLDRSFATAQDTIAGLEADLARYGNQLNPSVREEAERALEAGDFDAAERAYARITDHGEMEAQRTAAAYFQRGKIAEEQVRWHEAAEHYGRAASLSPTYDNLIKAGTFLGRAGRSGEAVRYEEDLVAFSKREHGDAATETALALNNLAESYRLLGRYADAEALYLKAIEIDKATIGEAHPDHATRLNNFALLLKDMGHFNDAEPLYRQAIEIDRVTIGEAHPDYAARLNNLANLLRAVGRHDEAEPLLRQVVDIDRAALGEAHPHYAGDLNNLANLLKDMGRHDEAEPLYRQAIEIDKATIGEAHPDYAARLNNLANLLRAMGRHDEAEPLLRQAMETTKATMGEAHPRYAGNLNNLANLLTAMGRHVEAEPLYRQAIDIDTETIGEAHPGYAMHLCNLALLLQAMGRNADAEPIFEQALAVYREALGDEHPTTRAVARKLAGLQRAGGWFGRAASRLFGKD